MYNADMNYSGASAAAAAALSDTASAGFPEEYDVRPNGKRVRRGNAINQIQAAVLLEAMADRRESGSPFRVAKMAPAR